MNIDDVTNLSVDGIDSKDYPNFCDAFFYEGFWAETGEPLTDEELDTLGEEYPEILNEMAFEHFM